MPELSPPVKPPKEVPKTDPSGIENDRHPAQASAYLHAAETVMSDGLMTFESVRDQTGTVATALQPDELEAVRTTWRDKFANGDKFEHETSSFWTSTCRA